MNCIFLRRGYGETGLKFSDTFSENDWETIILICQGNAVPDTWAVGDQKTMTINGKDYLIDIIGKGHDTYFDGSGTAPLTFQLHDGYGTKYNLHNTNTNTVGWTGCDGRTTHLPAIFATMPSEVQAGIREVNKLTSAGNSSTTIKTTADKLFLLSEEEVFGSAYFAVSGEGTQYAYYAQGGSTIKKFNGTADHQWLRSPYYKNSGGYTSTASFCAVNNLGVNNYNQPAKFEWMFAFAFCF